MTPKSVSIMFFIIFCISLPGLTADIGEWSYPLDNRTPKAVALIVHGFNGKASTMRDVAESLNREGVICLLMTLAGHGPRDNPEDMTAQNWKRGFEVSFRAAQERANAESINLYVVGHSMGCLVSSCVLTETDDLSGLAGCIYFAPADGLNAVLRGILPFSGLADLCPSTILGAIINNCSGQHAAKAEDLPIGQALLSLRELLVQMDHAEYSNCPTLVLVDSRDSLVSLARLTEMKELRELNWSIVSLESELGEPHMCTRKSYANFITACDTMISFIGKTIAEPQEIRGGQVNERRSSCSELFCVVQ